jgi:ABC-2 type transport system permease protein
MSATDTTSTDSAHTTQTGANRAGFTTAIGLVIEREIMVRLKSKAFMVSTILSIVLFGVLVGVSGALPSLFSSTDKVAVTSAGAKAVEGIDDIETRRSG